ncbi:MAG: hypothetical protein RLZZ324_1028 [Candidatus Parcubacteria bacterium]
MTNSDILLLPEMDRSVKEFLREHLYIDSIESFLLRTRDGEEREAFLKRTDIHPKKLDEYRASAKELLLRLGPPVEYDGVLEGFFETGTEGVIWMLYETAKIDADGKRPYDGLQLIEDFDRLVIRAEDGHTLFDEEIMLDWKAGYRPFPMNPEHGQQCALGFWIHGVQRGWEPDAWARFFFPSDGKELAATLIKHPPRID